MRGVRNHIYIVNSVKKFTIKSQRLFVHSDQGLTLAMQGVTLYSKLKSLKAHALICGAVYLDTCSRCCPVAPPGPAKAMIPASTPVQPMKAKPTKNDQLCTTSGNSNAPATPSGMTNAVGKGEAGRACARRKTLGSIGVCDLQVRTERQCGQERAQKYGGMAGIRANQQHADQPDNGSAAYQDLALDPIDHQRHDKRADGITD